MIFDKIHYLGREPWNFPKSLSDTVNADEFPEKLSSLCNDYKLNIINKLEIPDNELLKM